MREKDFYHVLMAVENVSEKETWLDAKCAVEALETVMEMLKELA